MVYRLIYVPKNKNIPLKNDDVIVDFDPLYF